jgi:hypothetical protein
MSATAGGAAFTLLLSAAARFAMGARAFAIAGQYLA